LAPRIQFLPLHGIGFHILDSPLAIPQNVPGIGGLSSREAEAAYKANARLYVVRGYTFRENSASAQICVNSARSASSLGKEKRGHTILMRRNVFSAIAAFSSGVIGLKTAIIKHPNTHRLTLLRFIQIIPPSFLV